MKSNHRRSLVCIHFRCVLPGRLLVAALLIGLLANVAQAFSLVPDGTNNPSYKPLDSWSFYDTTNWTSDKGYVPISFANLNESDLGDDTALVMFWFSVNVPFGIES